MNEPPSPRWRSSVYWEGCAWRVCRSLTHGVGRSVIGPQVVSSSKAEIFDQKWMVTFSLLTSTMPACKPTPHESFFCILTWIYHLCIRQYFLLLAMIALFSLFSPNVTYLFSTWNPISRQPCPQLSHSPASKAAQSWQGRARNGVSPLILSTQYLWAKSWLQPLVPPGKG